MVPLRPLLVGQIPLVDLFFSRLGSRVVKGGRLKICCIYFVGSNPTSVINFHINSITYMKNYQGNYHEYRVVFLSPISSFCHSFLRLPNNAIIYVKLVYLNGRANLARRTAIVTLRSVLIVCASTSNSSSSSSSSFSALPHAQLQQTPYTTNQPFFS